MQCVLCMHCVHVVKSSTKVRLHYVYVLQLCSKFTVLKEETLSGNVHIYCKSLQWIYSVC